MEEQKEEISYQSVINNLDSLVKDDTFKSKDELKKYIQSLRINGVSRDILTKEKILEYLNLYDEYHRQEASMNLENYKGVNLDNKNMIISTQTDQVLKTNTSNEQLPEEFKKTQNELSTETNDGLANANQVFDYMKNYEKEEMNFLSMSEVLNSSNIDTEILQKIKFFISNQYMNPYSFSVNLDSGIFYNNDTKELFEVRKNEQTGKYEIYKGGEIVHSEENTQESYQSDSPEFDKTVDTNEEEMPYKKNNSYKVRRLIKDLDKKGAIVTSSLLVIIITTLSILIAIFILTHNK